MTADLFETEAPSTTDKDQDGATFVLRVHLQPGAGPAAVMGRNGTALALKVAPPPSDPRANQAAKTLLSELMELDEAQIELVSGERGPAKRFRLSGIDEAVLRRQLDEAIEHAARGRAGARGGRGSR